MQTNLLVLSILITQIALMAILFAFLKKVDARIDGLQAILDKPQPLSDTIVVPVEILPLENPAAPYIIGALITIGVCGYFYFLLNSKDSPDLGNFLDSNSDVPAKALHAFVKRNDDNFEATTNTVLTSNTRGFSQYQVIEVQLRAIGLKLKALEARLDKLIPDDEVIAQVQTAANAFAETIS